MDKQLWEHYSRTTYDRVEDPEKEGLEGMLQMRLRHIPEECNVVLDAGCSVGWTTNWLQQQGKDAWGISYNKADVEEAQRRGYKQIFEMDLHDLSYFETDGFDCVFCSHAFEHVLAPHIVLCEFNRLLRKNGTLILILPTEDWKQSYTHPAHVNWWLDDQLIFLVETRGFKCVDTWREATNVRTRFGARGDDKGYQFVKTETYKGIRK